MDTHRLARMAGWIGAVTFIVAGVWALAAPRSFFDEIATFDPYNQHFVQDIGAFQIGLGAVLLLAIIDRPGDALSGALIGSGIGSLAHALSHVIGRDLGGSPAVDIPVFTILGALLLVVGLARRRV